MASPNLPYRYFLSTSARRLHSPLRPQNGHGDYGVVLVSVCMARCLMVFTHTLLSLHTVSLRVTAALFLFAPRLRVQELSSSRIVRTYRASVASQTPQEHKCTCGKTQPHASTVVMLNMRSETMEGVKKVREKSSNVTADLRCSNQNRDEGLQWCLHGTFRATTL